MIRTAALKTNFFHLDSTINWDTPLFLRIVSHSALIVGKAGFKAVWFGPPGNEWRTDSQTDGCSLHADGDKQMAECPFREKL